MDTLFPDPPLFRSRPTSGAGAGGEGSGGAESGDGGAADDEPADMGFQPRGISSIDSVTTAARTLGRHSRERPALRKAATLAGSDASLELRARTEEGTAENAVVSTVSSRGGA